MTDQLGQGSYKIDVDKTKADASIKGFESSVKKSGDAVEDAIGKKATGAMGKLKTAMAGISKGGGIGGAILGGVGIGAGLGVMDLAVKGIGMVTDFLGEASAAASDLAETQGKLDLVFKTQANVIRDWAKDSAESMGLSTQAALEAAGTFGNFLQAMGTSEDAAASMSEKMVQLASDLGALNNTSAEDALAALQSGLSGEAEPMKRFGVVLSDAAVSAQLLADGVKKVGGRFTEAEKVTGRYKLIMQQTTTAQGNFRDTNQDTAGAAKVAAAQMANLTAKAGGFANVLQGLVNRTTGAFVGFLDDVVDALSDDGPTPRIKEFTDAVIAARREMEKTQPPAEDFLAWIATLDKGPVISDKLKDAIWYLGPLAQKLGMTAQELQDFIIPLGNAGLGLSEMRRELVKWGDEQKAAADAAAALAEGVKKVPGAVDAMTFSIEGLAASVADPLPSDIAALAASGTQLTDLVADIAKADTEGTGRYFKLLQDNVVLLNAHFEELPPTVQESMRLLGLFVETGVDHAVKSFKALPLAVHAAIFGAIRTMRDAKEPWKAAWKALADSAKDPFNKRNFEDWMDRYSRRAAKKAEEAGNRTKIGKHWQALADAAKNPVIRATVLMGLSIQQAADALATVEAAGAAVSGLFNLWGNAQPATPRPRRRHRQMGGPMDAFTPYIVGERGPELVVPRAAATVIPADRTARMVTNHGPSYTVNVQGLVRAETPDDIGRQMRRLAMMGAGA